MQIDLNKYHDFVAEVTSDASNYPAVLVERITEIVKNSV